MTKIQKTKLNFRHFQLCLKFNNLKCEKKNYTTNFKRLS